MIPQEELDGVTVRFVIEADVDKKASAAAGRPVHKDVVFGVIGKVGDRYSETWKRVGDPFWLDREAGELLPVELVFPREYEAFVALHAGEDQIVGTPLAELPGMTASRIADYHHFNVRTVEQLSQVPDKAVSKMGLDVQDWRDKAKRFLEQATDETVILDLKRQVANLTSMLEASTAPEGSDDRPINPLFETMQNNDLRAYLIDQQVEVKHGWKRSDLLREASTVAEKIANAA